MVSYIQIVKRKNHAGLSKLIVLLHEGKTRDDSAILFIQFLLTKKTQSFEKESFQLVRQFGDQYLYRREFSIRQSSLDVLISAFLTDFIPFRKTQIGKPLEKRETLRGLIALPEILIKTPNMQEAVCYQKKDTREVISVDSYNRLPNFDKNGYRPLTEEEAVPVTHEASQDGYYLIELPPAAETDDENAGGDNTQNGEELDLIDQGKQQEGTELDTELEDRVKAEQEKAGDSDLATTPTLPEADLDAKIENEELKKAPDPTAEDEKAETAEVAVEAEKAPEDHAGNTVAENQQSEEAPEMSADNLPGHAPEHQGILD